jgi:hypothetical protein
MKNKHGTMTWFAGVGALVATATFPLAARAQLALAPGVSAQAADQHVKSGIGVSLQAGGGVTDFTGSTSRAETDTGGYWDVRAVFGTRSFLGAELAYVGSSRGLSTGAVLGSNASLVSHGGEGTLRFQLPFASSDGLLLEPFAFAGVGWSRYNFRNLSAGVTSSSDSVGTVPVGGGLVVGYRGFMVDARITYRPTASSSSPEAVMRA